MRHHRTSTRARMSVVAGVITAAAVLAAPAAFAADPASLDGEVFSGAATITNVSNCDGTGLAMVSYSSHGTATGPYAGSYTETGTVTEDEDNESIVNWAAHFVIMSPS